MVCGKAMVLALNDCWSFGVEHFFCQFFKGETMEKKTALLYRTDNVAVLISIAILWMVVLFVLIQVVSISPDRTFSTIITVSAFAVLASLTATSIALLMHLKINKIAIYTEEIINQNNN